MTADHALSVPHSDALDLLATPVAWTDAEGRIVACEHGGRRICARDE